MGTEIPENKLPVVRSMLTCPNSTNGLRNIKYSKSKTLLMVLQDQVSGKQAQKTCTQPPTHPHSRFLIGLYSLMHHLSLFPIGLFLHVSGMVKFYNQLWSSPPPCFFVVVVVVLGLELGLHLEPLHQRIFSKGLF
jgi:hypothetical protein